MLALHQCPVFIIQFDKDRNIKRDSLLEQIKKLKLPNGFLEIKKVTQPMKLMIGRDRMFWQLLINQNLVRTRLITIIILCSTIILPLTAVIIKLILFYTLILCSGSNVVEKLRNREFDVQDKESNKPKQSSYFRVLMVFTILLVISVGWKWIHLYQNAIAKREANVSRLFDKCHKRSWYSTLTGILFWEDEATKCKEYFLAMYANPMFEVNPMDACILT